VIDYDTPNFHLLFRWFVGLNMDHPVRDVSVFTKSRQRQLEGVIVEPSSTGCWRGPGPGSCSPTNRSPWSDARRRGNDAGGTTAPADDRTASAIQNGFTAGIPASSTPVLNSLLVTVAGDLARE